MRNKIGSASLADERKLAPINQGRYNPFFSIVGKCEGGGGKLDDSEGKGREKLAHLLFDDVQVRALAIRED